MPTYIVLGHMTQQGVQNAKEITQRSAARKEAAEALGVTLRESYLTMGAYDVVLIVDAPNGEAMAKFALQVGMRGNLTTQTLRGFNETETEAILSDL